MSETTSVGQKFASWISVWKHAVFRGERGRVARALRAAAEAKQAILRADRTSARLRAAMDELPEGLVLLDPEGRYIHWNKSYAEIYRRSADLFEVGVKMEDTLRVGVARGDYPEAIGREDEWIAARMNRLANPGKRHDQQLADGRWIMIDERRLQDGCSIGLRVDVTEMKNREASFRLLFESNPIPMFVFDKTSREILAVNEAAVAHYGYSYAQFAAMRLDDIVDATNLADPASDLDETPTAGSSVHIRADGSRIDVATYSRDFIYEGRPGILVASIDTTERNRSEARIAFMARHDPLTNLPNRTLFRERLEEALANFARKGTGFAVLLVDLDHFKHVNDTLGHSTGDLLLQSVADRLLEAIGPADIVARLGGDEFAILRMNAGEDEDAAPLARRILTHLARPFEIDGRPITIATSIGVSLMPRDSQSAEILMKHADLALYASKGRGRGTFSFFEPELDAAMRARATLESELRHALAHNELKVHYQPIVDLRTGRPRSMEALVRWAHPTRGMVLPNEFIPLAEEIGLIGAIGELVLNRACLEAAEWADDIKIAINLSPLQFRRSNILAMVMKALERSGLPARRLDIEITEALLMEKSEATLATLKALRALGVGISMDDFGTGYSSLSYLQSFPFSKIKIDRSFVHAISQQPDSQAIVRAIVGLGASLGMEVTAEGIERKDDLDYLISAGCQEGQGYYFSQSRPAHELAEWLGDKNVKAAA